MRAFFAMLLLCFVHSAPAFASPNFHVVKEGEILSRVARRYFGAPTYSGAGALAKVLRLNPQIANPDNLAPGTIIYLEPRERKPAGATKKVDPVPAPPVSARADSEPVPDEVPHRLLAFAKYRMATLTAVDNATHARAQLQTNYDLAAGAEWSQNWSENVTTSFSGELRQVSFAPPTSASKTLSNHRRTLASLGFGAKRKFGKSLELGVSLGYGSRLFISSPDQRTVNLDAAAIPLAGVDARYELISRGRTSLQLAGGVSYLNRGRTDTYALAAGKEWSASINLVRSSDEKTYGISLGYSERIQNTSLVGIREEGAWAAFTYSLPLFGGGR